MKADQLSSRSIRQYKQNNSPQAQARAKRPSNDDATKVSLEASRSLKSSTKPITEEEADELALKITRHLKFSSEAFGAEATLFNDISQGRARELLS